MPLRVCKRRRRSTANLQLHIMVGNPGDTPPRPTPFIRTARNGQRARDHRDPAVRRCSMPIESRRRFLTNAALAGAAGFGGLGIWGKALAAEPPPEITTVRFE